jgi:hypothetical protein
LHESVSSDKQPARPVLQRLGDAVRLHPLLPGEGGDGAGELEDAVAA